MGIMVNFLRRGSDALGDTETVGTQGALGLEIAYLGYRPPFQIILDWRYTFFRGSLGFAVS